MANPCNSVTLIGRLGADPELRYTSEGTAVCSFRFAVPDGYKRDVSHWFDGVAWRQQAEYLANYCTKGDRIAVAGHLKVEQWETPDGDKRSKVKIEADAVTNLSPKKDDDEQPHKSSSKKDTDEKRTKRQSRDDEEETPRKKARHDEEEDDEPAPKKKRQPRDEEEEEAPRKKRRSRDEDDAEFESV